MSSNSNFYVLIGTRNFYFYVVKNFRENRDKDLSLTGERFLHRTFRGTYSCVFYTRSQSRNMSRHTGIVNVNKVGCLT